MNRSSLKYLIVGLLAGGLVSSGIDAAALVSPGSPIAAGTAAVHTVKKKKGKKKKKVKAKKKKKAALAPPAAPPAGIPLVGLFRFTPGAFAGGNVSGSYVRLIQPGGSVEKGPFFVNPNSKATTYTLLSPGTEGGLRTGSYQEPPNPAFSPTGDALTNRIMAPQRFAFILYSLSTAPKDPQTGLDVPPPSISVSDGTLSGQLQAFSAQWNKQFFNQGSPKPDGSSPGLTSPVTGTYNADTKAYTLQWTSQIVGGAFNNFSGVWHIEGIFEPRCG
ncbi:MAG: hypothetical protein QOK16_4311 [Solirubrobacteraceae bacterium]|jgi:hypothetical protein|nr:hypothetical protein [Solirubrobacteraceae bacterium]